MDVKEIKLLLKLLGKSAHRGKPSEIKPDSKTKISETETICRSLRDRDLISCSETILKIKLTAAGKALLKLDTSQLPITKDELKIIQACSKNQIPPSSIKIIPPQKRDELIRSLIEKGLIAPGEIKIKEVCLTKRGKEFLWEDYIPQGNRSVLSLDLLGNYLHFCRQHFSNFRKVIDPPSDAEILQSIINLDREIGTNNYLPIFYLRQQLSQSLSRKDLDEALYRLQGENKIELSSLVEATQYTSQQISAGITQEVGGCLFFLIVNQ